MIYALNLGQDNRILSTTYAKYAAPNAPLVDHLPEGNVSDYLYMDGNYIYNPLPKPEQPEPESAPTVWDELDAAYQSGYNEGYTEGVNTAYDQ